jgi:hypothetical protein
MKNQKYSVKLTDAERNKLKKAVVSKWCTPECKTHAKVILNLDENGKNLSVEETAQKCKLHPENVYKIRKQFVTYGMERILNRKKLETPPVPGKVTGEVEAYIIATACSEPPEGRSSWTLRLLAEKVVLDGVVESISTVTVMRTLKKRNISRT